MPARVWGGWSGGIDCLLQSYRDLDNATPAIFLSEGASEFGAKVVLFQMGDGIGMPHTGNVPSG